MAETSMHSLKKFEQFLETVDLTGYRAKYQPMKIVEMDMPPNTQALAILYRVYWNEARFPEYNSFYDEYLKEHRAPLEAFQKRTGMCEGCFYKGLPARIYRTWASIITQIHAGYVAENIFGKDAVTMSETLDHQGADFRVHYRGKYLNYQVKKKSFSGEVRRGKGGAKKKLEGERLDLEYTVPNFEHIKNPKKKNGKGLYKDYSEFKKKFLDTKKLRVLSNGFVVFTPYVFEQKKRDIDAKKSSA